MDDPDLDPASHRRALACLRRINRLSRSAGMLWPPIRAVARTIAGRPARVLDVASGGGDVPIRLWQRARRARLPLEIVGLDISPVAIDVARGRARAAGAE